MATQRGGLRAVEAGEKSPVPPKTVTQAAAKGSTRELLVAMRDRIAQAVESQNTSPRDLAALTKRLHEVVRDIEAIDAHDDEGSTANAAQDAAFDASAI